MSSLLVNPTSAGTANQFSLAPRRFTDLNGKRLGLLNNSKFNADNLLDGIGELLSDRYSIREIIRVTKPYFGRPIPDDIAKEMASRCDVMITAIGD